MLEHRQFVHINDVLRVFWELKQMSQIYFHFKKMAIQVSSLNDKGERTPLNYNSFTIKKEKLSVFIRVLPWTKGHLIYINIDKGK